MTIAPTSTQTTQSIAPSCSRYDLGSSPEQDVAAEHREALRLQRSSLLEIRLGAGIAVVFLRFTHARLLGIDQQYRATVDRLRLSAHVPGPKNPTPTIGRNRLSDRLGRPLETTDELAMPSETGGYRRRRAAPAPQPVFCIRTPV